MEVTSPMGRKYCRKQAPVLTSFLATSVFSFDFCITVYTVHMWKTVCPVLCGNEVQVGDKLGKIL